MFERPGLISIRVPILPLADISDRVAKLLRLDAKNYESAQQFFDRLSYFFFRESHPEFLKKDSCQTVLSSLKLIRDGFATITDQAWDEAELHQSLEKLRDRLVQQEQDTSGGNRTLDDCKASISRDIHRVMRWIISFNRPGPGYVWTMATLGREESLERLDDAIVAHDATEKSLG